MRLLLALSALLAFAALFVRSYTLPPAPDRQGGTIIVLSHPDRPLFGSPRGDCLGAPQDEPAIPCLIASVARSRSEGIALLRLPFCARCHDLSQRIALHWADPEAAQAKLAQIGRFGW